MGGSFRAVSDTLPTIIDRAKKNDFSLPKKQKKTIHDREVLTHYIGELIQHDPLITSGLQQLKKNGI